MHMHIRGDCTSVTFIVAARSHVVAKLGEIFVDGAGCRIILVPVDTIGGRVIVVRVDGTLRCFLLLLLLLARRNLIQSAQRAAQQATYCDCVKY